eukprot:g6396.t1
MTTLPGYSSTRQSPSPRRQNFHITSENICSERYPPPRSPRAKDPDRFSTTNSLYGAPSPRSEAAFSPRFAELDKKVLKFTAFFQEGVQESAIETYRFRHCLILYYLEDDSLKITEPRETNSGIPQGVFLKRHQVPKPESDGASGGASGGGGGAALSSPFYGWADLQVGAHLEIYSRVYRVTGCDPFTRNFYEDQGMPQGPDEASPQSPAKNVSHGASNEDRRGPDGEIWAGKQNSTLKKFMEASLGKFTHDSAALDQYIKNDGKVLRFQCIWDDRTLHGGMQRYTLLFFLANSTIQIREVHDKNDGREHYPKLLERRRLLKNWERGSGPGGPGEGESFYGPEDLIIGKTVDVFSRKMTITSCDSFTREYYSDVLQIPQPPNAPKAAPAAPPPEPALPPPTGFGTDDDSLASVKNVGLPPFKMPQRDIRKFMEMDGKVLRYEARLVSSRPEDQERLFIVAFYLADDTQAVYEPVRRNSGIVGGKYLERNKYKREDGRLFEIDDFKVGGTVVFLNSVNFALFSQDNFTTTYLKARADAVGTGDGEVVAAAAAAAAAAAPEASAEDAMGPATEVAVAAGGGDAVEA